MYLIVSKGTKKIQESAQIRDSDFSLLVSCPLKLLKKKLRELNIEESKTEQLLQLAAEKPEGEIIEF
jgi:hypothetical protein